jgi:hypothetical protein
VTPGRILIAYAVVAILIVGAFIWVVRGSQISYALTGEPVIDCGRVAEDRCMQMFNRLEARGSSPIIFFKLADAGGCVSTRWERLNGKGGLSMPLC